MSSILHQRSLAAVIWLCAGSGLAGLSTSAAAQATPAQPSAAEPAQAAPSSSAAPPAAAPTTAPAESPPPAATDAPAPKPAPATEVVPAPPAGSEPASASSQYGSLGGPPDKPVQEGEWNPWDHPESETHGHQGFFLRLQIGPGGSTVWKNHEDFSGFGLGMGLAIGGSVVRNLALHVDLQTSWLLSPSRELDGQDANFDANIALQSLGLGVTYHFVPINFFASASFGIGRLAFETEAGETKETGPGFTLNLVVGKEWWVGADWGIGVAAQVVYMNVEDYTQDADRLDAMAINILFTATYN